MLHDQEARNLEVSLLEEEVFAALLKLNEEKLLAQMELQWSFGSLVGFL